MTQQVREIERTEIQNQAIAEVENYLRKQTAQSLRTNKTKRGLTEAVSAANQATGQARDWVGADIKEKATDFFTTFETGGFNAVFAAAPRWM